MGKWVVSVENDISGRESHYFEEISNPQISVCGRISTFLMSGEGVPPEMIMMRQGVEKKCSHFLTIIVNAAC